MGGIRQLSWKILGLERLSGGPLMGAFFSPTARTLPADKIPLGSTPSGLTSEPEGRSALRNRFHRQRVESAGSAPQRMGSGSLFRERTHRLRCLSPNSTRGAISGKSLAA